jgi:hypothetical protein
LPRPKILRFWNKPFLGTGERPRAFALINRHLLFKGGFKMDKGDWELLDKQLRGVSSPPQNGMTIGLTIVAVFLIGIGMGDILSKSKQANTNYAAVISRLAGAPP